MESDFIKSFINSLISLEYINIYIGALDNPVQDTYVLYSDIIFLISKYRKELKNQLIRETAYFIWLETGCIDEHKNWLKAKKIVEKAEKMKNGDN